jgi:hypothetical protein
MSHMDLYDYLKGSVPLLSHLLPLPPGEGWGEGIKSSQLPDFLSPHPVLLGNCSMHCSTSCMAQASLSTGSRSHLLHAVVPEGEGTHCLYSDV